MAPTVFISYRREETAGHAGRLNDVLVERLGARNVTMDVNLPPGIDFVQRIAEAVAACDVLLVVMGPRWAALAADGRAEDFVRLEVETALAHPDVAVVPVLVAGASMPAPAELPESLRALSHRNAFELSDARWHYDAGRLVDSLLGQPEPEAARRPRALVAVGALVAAAAAVAAALALAGVFSGGSGGGDGVSGGGGSGASARSFTTDDAVRVVGAYARLYGAKDLNGLRRLMSPDVVLKRRGQPDLHGAGPVLARYRRELGSFGKRKPTFDWDHSLTDSNQDALEVIGPYAISASGLTRETGRFGFRLTQIGSSLLISELCFGCPDVRHPHALLAG